MSIMETIQARFVFEIMGRPAEHVKLTMENLIDKIGTEKGVRVISKKVHDPRPVENSKDLFTTFAEVEVSFDTIEMFMGIVFAYMPSNVDVFSPSSMRFTSEQVGSLGNMLIGKLHMYEAITKRLLGERDVLINKLKSLEQPSSVVEDKKADVKKSKKGKKKKK